MQNYNTFSKTHHSSRKHIQSTRGFNLWKQRSASSTCTISGWSLANNSTQLNFVTMHCNGCITDRNTSKEKLEFHNHHRSSKVLPDYQTAKRRIALQPRRDCLIKVRNATTFSILLHYTRQTLVTKHSICNGPTAPSLGQNVSKFSRMAAWLHDINCT